MHQYKELNTTMTFKKVLINELSIFSIEVSSCGSTYKGTGCMLQHSVCRCKLCWIRILPVQPFLHILLPFLDHLHTLRKAFS